MEEWCKRCDLCTSEKDPKTRTRGKLGQYISGDPRNRIAAEFWDRFL